MTGARRNATAGALLALAALALITGRALAANLHSVPVAQGHVLDRVPARIGAWAQIPDTTAPVNPARLDALGRPGQIYDAMVSRTYGLPDGTQIMLMLAWQREQHQEDRIHSPELCYVAQGFVLLDPEDLAVPIGTLTIPARTFDARSLSRDEEVIYWIRTGQGLRANSVATRWEIFTAGLRGRIDDGILVRVSTTDLAGPARSTAEKQALLARFMADLVRSVPADTRAALLGRTQV
jgi:EpsI family protein